MLKLLNIRGGGFDNVPYKPDMPLGEFMRTVIAHILGLQCVNQTVQAHVQTYRCETLIVFNDENCERLLGATIADGGTLFYSLTSKAVAGNAGSEPLPQCAVCLASGGALTLLCGHSFHAKCVAAWIDSHKNTCPECRAPFDNSDFDACRLLAKKY